MSTKETIRAGSIANYLDASVVDQLQAMRDSLAKQAAPEQPVPAKNPLRQKVSERSTTKPITTDKVAAKTQQKANKKPYKSQSELVKQDTGGSVDIFVKPRVESSSDSAFTCTKPPADDGVKDREILSRAGKKRVERALSFSSKRPQGLLANGLTVAVMQSMAKHNVNLVTGSEGPLVLKVRRGLFLKETAFCSVCHSPTAPLYRYADSNYGAIILCSKCKTSAFERSFGHADAMPLAVDHAHAHKGKW